MLLNSLLLLNGNFLYKLHLQHLAIVWTRIPELLWCVISAIKKLFLCLCDHSDRFIAPFSSASLKVWAIYMSTAEFAFCLRSSCCWAVNQSVSSIQMREGENYCISWIRFAAQNSCSKSSPVLRTHEGKLFTFKVGGTCILGNPAFSNICRELNDLVSSFYHFKNCCFPSTSYKTEPIYVGNLMTVFIYFLGFELEKHSVSPFLSRIFLIVELWPLTSEAVRPVEVFWVFCCEILDESLSFWTLVFSTCG